MHPACIDCTMKHLGEAHSWDVEVQMGYPRFVVYVVGALSHASMEIQRLSPRMAMTIREHRLRWMEDHTYDIPYEELGEWLEIVKVIPEGTPWPDPPDMPLGFTGDARP